MRICLGMNTFATVFVKKSSNISTIQRALFFILGLLVAAFVVSKEVIDQHCAKLSVAVEQEQEEADSEQEPVAFQAVQYDVVLPAFGVDLEPFSPIFICDLIQEPVVSLPIPASIPITDIPYFKTLFRQIISPNAP